MLNTPSSIIYDRNIRTSKNCRSKLTASLADSIVTKNVSAL